MAWTTEQKQKVFGGIASYVATQVPSILTATGFFSDMAIYQPVVYHSAITKLLLLVPAGLGLLGIYAVFVERRYAMWATGLGAGVLILVAGYLYSFKPASQVHPYNFIVIFCVYSLGLAWLVGLVLSALRKIGMITW